MSKVDDYLKPALAFWTQEQGEKDSLPGQYKGYVASLGTSIIHCGLVPAVFMFSGNDEVRSDEDKSFLLKGILHILDIKSHSSLLDYVLENDTPYATARICDAIVAMKLALRTFKLTKNG